MKIASIQPHVIHEAPDAPASEQLKKLVEENQHLRVVADSSHEKEDLQEETRQGLNRLKDFIRRSPVDVTKQSRQKKKRDSKRERGVKAYLRRRLGIEDPQPLPGTFFSRRV